MEKFSKLDLENAAKELSGKFTKDKSSAIKLIGTNIMEYPELVKFLGSESYDVMMQKGIVALRPGFYKIIEQPYEKDYGNGITTFAATVLYFANIDDRCIQYDANIGPMVNANAQYTLLGGDQSQDKLMRDFLKDRPYDNTKNYTVSKTKFFNQVYNLQKMFWVQTAEFSKIYPESKEIYWTFFN